MREGGLDVAPCFLLLLLHFGTKVEEEEEQTFSSGRLTKRGSFSSSPYVMGDSEEKLIWSAINSGGGRGRKVAVLALAG